MCFRCYKDYSPFPELQSSLGTTSGNMRTLLTVLGVLAASHSGHSNNVTDTRGGSKETLFAKSYQMNPITGKLNNVMLYNIYFSEAFSLFSIVQFPNQQCTASSSSSTYGTCYTSSECTSKGGSSDGNCAAGFGVCCKYLT